MFVLSAQGAEFIARYEGFRANPYFCEAGKRTIGFGHVMQKGEAWPDGIREGQALDLLLQDATREARPVVAALKAPVKPHEADALISLAYNMGGGAIAKSTLLRLINDGQREAAADQFLVWDKVRVDGSLKPSRGLRRRRIAERRLFLFADYEGG
jgi:lysozyme